MTPKYSNQDIRAEVIKVRDELLTNLKFIMECIEEDRHVMEGYRSRFKDIRYRPILSTDATGYITYGLPTDLVIEPLASKMRASINSLLQSIRLIQSEILPEDNPEGETLNPTDGVSTKRTSLRDQFKAEAQHTNKAIEPELEEPEEIELVENANPTPKAPSKPTTQTKLPTETKPKPWRDKPQSKFVPSVSKDVVKEPIDNSNDTPPQPTTMLLTNPNTLDAESERMKAELLGLKGSVSRMSQLASKYGKRKANVSDEED